MSAFEQHRIILKVAIKFQKSSFLDIEDSSEYGSGFARLLKNIKNGACDIYIQILSNCIDL